MIKLIFKNCYISKDINLKGRIIYDVEYGNYENYKYYMKFYLDKDLLENELVVFEAEKIDIEVLSNT